MPEKKIIIRELYLVRLWFFTIAVAPFILLLYRTFLSSSHMISSFLNWFIILLIAIVGGMFWSIPWLIGMSLIYLIIIRFELTEFLVRTLFLVSGVLGICMTFFVLNDQTNDTLVIIYSATYILSIFIIDPKIKNPIQQM